MIVSNYSIYQIQAIYKKISSPSMTYLINFAKYETLHLNLGKKWYESNKFTLSSKVWVLIFNSIYVFSVMMEYG